jgi:hypothetical protein
MTIPRHFHCSNPDCPHEKSLMISNWMRDNAPQPGIQSGTHYNVLDIDLVLRDYETKKMMFLENKIFMGKPTVCQEYSMKDIDYIMKAGSPFRDNYEFLGYHLIQSEKTCFNDGRVYFDHKEVSEDDMRKIVRF